MTEIDKQSGLTPFFTDIAARICELVSVSNIRRLVSVLAPREKWIQLIFLS